ncbi:DUF6428 family protein [Membranihabitans marinus]
MVLFKNIIYVKFILILFLLIEKQQNMKLSEIKTHLERLDQISFVLPDGSLVPSHFHVTEVGKVNKHFIDCGGTVRNEEVVNFQLWDSVDYDHRLHPEKLLDIIVLSERVLEIGDHEIEVEYQGSTIGKYGLDIENDAFILTNKATDCLAKEKCGIEVSKSENQLKVVATAANTCTPGGGCC